MTRFDRELTEDGTIRRLDMEDASQVLDVRPAAKYAVGSEQAVIALSPLTAAPMIAARNLYLQFLFAWLTGNGDLHAKNVSILRARDGRWQVDLRTLPLTGSLLNGALRELARRRAELDR